MEDSKLKAIFIDDVGLKTKMVVEPYFTYFLNLFENECQSLTKWEALMAYIKEKGLTPQDYIGMRSNVAKDVIEAIKATDEYATFLESPMDFAPSIGKVDIYTNNFDGKEIISYDMKSSNFQVMKHFNESLVLGCETYDELISKFTDCPLLIGSKSLRQYIFGNLNQKRIMNLSQCASTQLARAIGKRDGLHLIGVNNDEVFYGVTDPKLIGEPQMIVFDGIEFTPSRFTLRELRFIGDNGKHIKAYVKEHSNGKKTIHSCMSVFYPQVYKLVNMQEISDYDLAFIHEGILSSFNHPLQIVE